MKPKSIMILGAIVAVFSFVGSFYDSSMFVVLSFAGGMLFGKGYGILEERDLL